MDSIYVFICLKFSLTIFQIKSLSVMSLIIIKFHNESRNWLITYTKHKNQSFFSTLIHGNANGQLSTMLYLSLLAMKTNLWARQMFFFHLTHEKFESQRVWISSSRFLLVNGRSKNLGCRGRESLLAKTNEIFRSTRITQLSPLLPQQSILNISSLYSSDISVFYCPWIQALLAFLDC